MSRCSQTFSERTGFDGGEDVRVIIAPATKNEATSLQHPITFRTCDLILISKIDVLP